MRFLDFIFRLLKAFNAIDEYALCTNDDGFHLLKKFSWFKEDDSWFIKFWSTTVIIDPRGSREKHNADWAASQGSGASEK